MLLRYLLAEGCGLPARNQALAVIAAERAVAGRDRPDRLPESPRGDVERGHPEAGTLIVCPR